MKTDRLAIVALLLVCFFWGTTYLALRVGVTQIPPFLFTGLRMTIAGVIMGIYFFIKRPVVVITPKSIVMNALTGLLFFTFGVGMVGWGEQVVPSGLAALICALPPVWLVLINVFIYRIEKLNYLIVTGIFMGLAGMILVFHEHLADLAVPAYRFAIVVIVLANLGWVVATLIVSKAKPSSSSVFNSFIQMLSGGIGLLLLSMLFETHSRIVWTKEGVYALIYLITFGSIVAFAAYSYALSKLPVTLVSMHTYANVLVAIGLGSLLLHEMINALIIGAICITLLGIYFVNKGLNMNKKKNLTFNKAELKT